MRKDEAPGVFDLQAAAAVISFLLWVGSLFAPSVTECPGNETLPGWELLAFGAFGPATGQVGWYANPFMLWTMVRLASKVQPIVSASVGAMLAATAIFWTEDYDFNHTTKQICHHDLGFYLWLSCAGLLALATFFPVERRKGPVQNS